MASVMSFKIDDHLNLFVTLQIFKKSVVAGKSFDNGNRYIIFFHIYHQ